MSCSKSCLNCIYHYLRDINYDDQSPDYICVCGLTDEYLGYVDDRLMICKKYREI